MAMVGRFFAVVLAVLVGFAGQAAIAQAPCMTIACRPEATGVRVALIIGNSRYANSFDQIANPVNDTDRIAKVLKDQAGFDVLHVSDGSADGIAAAIDAFTAKASKADIALFYFAGHGFEFQGRNYLAPIDAPLPTSVAELQTRFVNLDRIVTAASKARKMAIFFIDACRVQPLDGQIVPVTITDAGSERPTAFGLLRGGGDAAVNRTQRVVFYATDTGQPALDADPANTALSPFANILSRYLTVPGVELTDLMQAVQSEVKRVTEFRQQPFVYGSWDYRFYFRSASDGGVTGAACDPATRRTGGPRLDVPPARLAREDASVLAPRLLQKFGLPKICEAAASDDPVALYLLGYFHEAGLGVTQDTTKARAWIERAAATEHPIGLTLLAYMLRGGTTEERQRAAVLAKRAADQGFPKAMNIYGDALMKGTLGTTDVAAGKRYVAQAAEAGYAYAMYLLAFAGEKPRARALLDGAVAAHDEEASWWICAMGAWGTSDAVALRRHCEVAAAADFPKAQLILGEMHRDGVGGPKSRERAAYWFARAANHPYRASDVGSIGPADRARLTRNVRATPLSGGELPALERMPMSF